MKTSNRYLKLTLAALVAAFTLSGVSSLLADDHWDNRWDARHHYRRDNYGYYDHGYYHHYETWHHHRGYWDDRGPFRVFIRVD